MNDYQFCTLFNLPILFKTSIPRSPSEPHLIVALMYRYDMQPQDGQNVDQIILQRLEARKLPILKRLILRSLDSIYIIHSSV